MGARSLSLRARVLLGAMVVSAMVVLMAPSIAVAANTATFSSASPRSGTYSQVRTPKLSISAYDRYGAKRTGITVYLDGRKVSYGLSYVVTGAWNPKKPDYRRFRLSYQVPSALAVGTHTVTVKIHDLKSKNSTYSWKFYVDIASAPATFSALTPQDGSSSAADRPRISATVADRWDVKGTGSYSMTIDGNAVPASISYITAGNYRSFRVSYQVVSALTAGSHSVTVSVRDSAARTTSQTWSFTVRPVPPTYPEMPVDGASCSDCHSGFPATHPTANCSGCHGAGAPPRPAGSIYAGDPMTPYAPSALSAHTMSCALEAPCHGGGGAFPHTVGNDCTRCHNASYPAIPPTHPIDATEIKNLHASDPTFCTADFCHSTSLTAEHFRHTTSDGVTKLTCGTCHGSKDPIVAAAIVAGSTKCTDCHSLSDAHPDTTDAHAAVGPCVRSGCHAVSVTTTHKNNCMACHAAGVIASTTCVNCHSAGGYHAGQPAAHALSVGGCVAYDCHGVSRDGVPLGMDAALTHKNDCSRCHSAGVTPSLDCVTCHAGSVLTLHTKATTAHTPEAIFCTTSNCHGSDVAATHLNSTRGCTACHAEGITPTTTCATCHSGDLVHTGAASAHDVTGVSCVAKGCHVLTDAASLHTATGGPGCVACHAVGQTPTLVCATAGCHPGSLPIIHSAAGGSHTSTGNSCIIAGCHSSDVTNSATNHKNCTACHGGLKPLSAQCANCHTQGIVPIHASADTSHTAPVGFCQTVCHSQNVATVHESKTSCIACHNPDGHAPSTVCADCHTGTPNVLHDFAIAGHVSTYPSCQLPGCHSTDVVDIHDGLPGMGCSKCHGVGITPSKNCGTCHPGDISTLHSGANASHEVPVGMSCDSLPQCHASNVATIHSATTDDCAACHEAGQTPSTTCANCHAGDDENIHRFGDSSHGASANYGCVSEKCHLTDVSSIHNAENGPSCLACHTAGVTPGTTCATVGCHLGDQTARHATRAGTKHDIAAGGCVTTGCHGTTAGGVNAAALHAGGPGCVACHSTGVTASLVCANCHSTDLNQVHTHGSAYHTAPVSGCDVATRNGVGPCHGLNVVALHGVAGGPNCAACHAPGVNPTARCSDCHTGAYWGEVHTPDTSHDLNHGTCVTIECHPGDAASIHPLNSPANDGPSCSPCHRQGTLTTNCTTCHTIDMTSRHSAQNVVHTASAGFCVNTACHGTDAGVNVASLHAGSTKSCAACHADGLSPVTTCLTCHFEDPLEIHTNIGTSHNASAGTCVQDGCHGTTAGGANLVTLHSAPWPGHTAPGCAACHGPGITPSANCSAAGCHASVPATEHAKFVGFGNGGMHSGRTPLKCDVTGCHTNLDVSSVHASLGCVCHQPDKTLTTACGTVGCHPEGDPAVHNAGASSHAASIPANGTCVGGDCHFQAVDTKHGEVGGPKCQACHAAGAGAATTIVCVDCHTDAGPPGKTPPGALPTPNSTPTPHPTAIAADTTHTVAVAGCSATGCHKTNVAAIHDVNVKKCMACHDGTRTLSKVCGDCHATEGHTAQHVVVRTDTCAGTSCHDSSNTNLTTLHPTCGICHDSINSTVVNAIATHNRNCSACHTFADHTAQHTVTRTDSCVGPACHVASNANLTTLHPTCATCHDASLRQAVKDAISGHDRTCAACHPFTEHTTMHVVTRTDTCAASGCHDASNTNLFTLHPTLGCATCHAAGVRQTVKEAIASHNTACNACHTFTDHVTQHAVPGRTDGCVLCHSETNLVPLHHTSGCDTCHLGTVRQTVKTAISSKNKTCAACHVTGEFHDGAVAKHTNVASTGCLGASCHQSDASVIHGRTSCVACHHALPNLAQPITCTSCHPTQSYATHAAIHNYCNNCHIGGDNYHGWNPGGFPFGSACNTPWCHDVIGSSPRYTGVYDHGSDCNIYSCHG
jgi:hypothetical protein